MEAKKGNEALSYLRNEYAKRYYIALMSRADVIETGIDEDNFVYVKYKNGAVERCARRVFLAEAKRRFTENDWSDFGKNKE